MARPNLSAEFSEFVFEEEANEGIGDWIVENLTLSGVPYSIITGTPDLSGYATTASLSGYVPTTRTVNGQALSADVSITTITGNAGTATSLQTARNINGVSFDGTTNITVTAAAGTLTGTTLNNTVVSSSLTSVGTLTNLTVTNPIAGSVTGSAATLTTARNINGVSFNGSADITITAAANGGNAATVTTNANLTGVVTSVGNATAIADGALSIAKTAGLQAALDAASGPNAIVTESTTARSMALTDIGKYVRLTNAGSCTITVPPNSTVNWAAQTRPPVLYFRIAAAGIPTLAGSGVTFNGSTKISTMAQHDTFALQWVASDVWDVV